MYFLDSHSFRFERNKGAMPSKAKKQSKSLSKLSNSDRLESSSVSSASTPQPDSDISEEDLLWYLDEASSKYPSLIGKSAFIGRVTDVDHDCRGCKIWLSEPSMVAFNIAPGSIVSVMLQFAFPISIIIV